MTAVAIGIAGCTAEPEPDGTPDTTTAPTTAAPTPPPLGVEDVVAEVEVSASPGTIAVEVLPLVRTPDGLVLTLDLTAQGDLSLGVHAELSKAGGIAGLALTGGWHGIRLLDLVDDVVAPLALDASDKPILSSPKLSDQVDTARVQLLFGDPGTDTLSMLLPQGGLVTDIPVLDGDPAALPDGQDPLPVDAVASIGVYPMESLRYDLLSTTRTEETSDALTIALGADVLFDVDSAELTDDALAVIADAAAELQSREPGPVQVIGHTDDRRDAAYNQDLSERRAEAVARALSDLVDTDSYPLEVSGRGETEPVASNATQEGRAANRRVELIVETPQVQRPEASSEAPEATGPVATGAEGVEIAFDPRAYRITAPRARLIDGNLILDLTVEATDDATSSAFGPAIFDGFLPVRGDRLSAMRTMAGIAVLNGSEAVMPAMHSFGDSEDTTMVLGDLSTFNRLDGGESRTSAIVYPNLEVGDTIAVQLIDTRDPENMWRLTDIPVEAD